jgi:uncharacterized membrane protein YedE/YeeE
MKKLISLIAGIIFGIGLVISEMVNPAKVLGFLDLFGNWDPFISVCYDWSFNCLIPIISSN